MKITQEIVRELLDYDPETGLFTWKKRDMSKFKTEFSYISWNKKYSGKRAGGIIRSKKSGYHCRAICILNNNYLEHRLAWIYMKGTPVPKEIDHLNRDGTDNRWSNLEESSRAKNSRNMSMNKRNKSGVSGVGWNLERRKWRANCKVNGVQKHLGYFEDIKDAELAVNKFRSENGFSSGHGRKNPLI